MGSEFDLFEHTNEQVMVSSAPVVEAMALLIAYEVSNKAAIFKEYQQLIQLVEQHPFTAFLKPMPVNQRYQLLNYLLPVPQLTSTQLFANKLRELKNEYVLYYFWDEAIPLKTIQELIENPSQITQIERTYYWQDDEAIAFAQLLLENVTIFKQQLAELLMKIGDHSVFLALLNKKKDSINQAISTVENLKLEPLARAQYVMGKTFRRVHDYKLYHFIPSYCMSPYRVRIFNDDVCYIIFGTTTPVEDKREKSEHLAKQLKAIGDPNRLLMLNMLASNKEYGAKLAEYLGITTATVSHHIEILKKVNLITEEKIGTIKYFTANKEQLNELLQAMQHFLKA
ncbi:metalloregulator ArsR/SmtB family transcription factor [Solibacillus sp. MA9]|uniref:Metalloregulator ArsR/SmtB family transcription factor n=1 Tax=Solibacillus palustris TaxID=2908203 RepID=A0ABS9UAH2_9BACL|nr:metalloregulator ArsR/SmtB family transcription factor [Solibacillus sp. MA9]MCH7321329.1 metalloregulator ArsR/SmtB family transcription factor [Solibacillus sp. MA9]